MADHRVRLQLRSIPEKEYEIDEKNFRQICVGFVRQKAKKVIDRRQLTDNRYES
jgi:hypothetical protein